MIDIPNVIPHRYPFLMIDKVLEVEPNKWVKGYKNVTWNEWYITEGNKHMPSTLIVEALAQLGAFASMTKDNGLGFLSSLNGIEVLGQASPGDRIDLYYEITKNKRSFVLGRGEASVGKKVIVKAHEIMIYIQPTR
ncbi:beta-hydroxyacyl-ACP dehydratase [Paenibacillus sp. N3/727]|uniref:3-hydroxyacyl-ACP dehydratase FabZ family protein n=1 Tax=Paenibacillus sp. N3/727 TaxID=2925845 RepID=UPI001F53145F|nr:3-hydroxyacyl-ACP dehydratase FabZ family protein [Paenibacillus sp. N3/727]UNK16988.1 beta-hydroxyacyl-ACP dehydratase [Paenibacillus sp. N3/727]